MFAIEDRGDRLVVRGELDLQTAGTFVATITLRGDGAVVDLCGVSFADSTGVHALLEVRRRVRVHYLHPSHALRETVRMLHLTESLFDGDGHGGY